MARVFLLLLLLPALAVCNYPWPDPVKQYKGYIEVNKTDGVHLFYWFFESRNDPDTDPLVLWLTGGPGCSSEMALFFENGPFLIHNTAEPVFNKFGWNAVANLLYVDQPVGTGFSYVKNPLGHVTNERQIGTELWEFILQFYQRYPKYSKLDLYIFGESYAGHYVPSTGQVIIESDSPYVKNFKGIGIGNGWVDPYIQYNAYAEYMKRKHFIDDTEVERAGDLYKICKTFLDLKLYPFAFLACQGVGLYVLDAAERKLGRSINMYDVRETCEHRPLCYDMDNITKFLNRDDVMKDLGVERKWEACRVIEELLLVDDSVHSFKSAAAAVLNSSRRVVVYSGVEDYICNFLGGKEWAEATQWSGSAEFDKATFKDWWLHDRVVGTFKSAAGMTFIEVGGAGHMVPFNQPEVALQILNHTIHDKPFVS